MQECLSSPGSECRSATKLALLEKRVENLEQGQKKESDFREAYYSEQRERIRRDAEMTAALNDVRAKVDQLVIWRQAEQEKPARSWDNLKDKIIWAVVGGVITFVLAQIGLA